MARLNVSIPDEVVERAHARGLDFSQLTTRAIQDEVARLDRRRELDGYLANLDAEPGLIPEDEAMAASEWVDRLLE